MVKMVKNIIQSDKKHFLLLKCAQCLEVKTFKMCNKKTTTKNE